VAVVDSLLADLGERSKARMADAAAARDAESAVSADSPTSPA
jgi:hypothetical protein